MGDEEEFPEEDFDDEESSYDPQIILKSLFRQIYCCSGALLLPIFGAITEQGVFVNYSFGKKDYEISFIVGEIIGFISGGVFISMYGRKLALIISNVSYLLITLVSFNSFYGNPLLFVPILMGFLLRFTMMAFIFYVAETSDITFRAFFFGSYYTIYYFGQFLLLQSNPIYKAIVVASILAFISSLMSLFVPETPYYLASKGDLEGAEDVFTWIRVGETDIGEYDLMLDKVEISEETQEVLALISSSTFFVSMLLCILLKISNFSACDLYQSLYKNLYLEKVKHVNKTEYYVYFSNVYLKFWMENPMNYMTIGSFVFICISFIIPRKIIYGLGFVFTLLLVIPVAFTPKEGDRILALYPFCYIISCGGREPLTLLLPVEILPAIIRNVGLMVMFIFEKVIQIYLFYSSDYPHLFYMYKRPGDEWIIISYSVSLIGVPFLLIFMPEMKGRSLFEVETVSLSFGSQEPEEMLPE